ncbi:MAG TPA: O-antigen ligase family protein [Ilumatobacter sp.]|nr:O-antigen ligase family protein [Ilumatobacter sp.]
MTALVGPPAVTLAVFAALAVLFARLRPVPAPHLSPPTRQLMLAGALFVGSGCVAYLMSPPDWAGVVTVAQLSLLPLACWVVRGAGALITRLVLWRSAALASAVSGLAAIVQTGLADAPRAAGWSVNSIAFGNLALVMVALTVLLADTPHDGRRTNSSVAHRRATWTSATLGLLAVALSGSRGVWLAVPAVAAVSATRSRRQQPDRSPKAVAAAVVVAVLGSVVIAGPTLARRVRAALAEVLAYVGEGSRSPASGTSIGARFEAWRTSFATFITDPLTGVGWGNLPNAFRDDVAAGRRHPRIAGFDHGHQQFLTALGSGGIVGAISMVLLLAVPAAWFSGARRGSGGLDQIGDAGIALVAVCAIAGITDTVLANPSFLLVYALAVGLLTVALENAPDRAPARSP